MLIGLGAGGLYGATGLGLGINPFATALPIPTPDLCVPTTEDLIGLHCCPPPSTEIIKFKLPDKVTNSLRTRPTAHKVDEIFKKLQNGHRPDEEPPRGRPTCDKNGKEKVHCNEIQVHSSWLFYPFHRWYLYFYERILAKLIEEIGPNFPLPFWNWDGKDGMYLPSIFEDDRSRPLPKRQSPEAGICVAPAQERDGGHHYELTNLDVTQNQYINEICTGRFTQLKSNLHKHYEKYDNPKVALAVGCPKELVDRRDEWEKKRRQTRSIERRRNFFTASAYDACLIGGQGFVRLKEVYVRSRNELAEQLHSTMVEKGQTILEEVASQLSPKTPIEEVFPPEDAGFQIMTDTLD
ncbi:polyphenol oxidase II, chloroplastic-like [Pyrus x bretschneideri]|uniref:polyphenol oxidase II, chloroplastic-like n=1 Tax=Pyrus x bretschneideri TaxID=225117 RepID=UPI002030BE53|nr:polyphenol oxidase II, chloroplastic-like [Pyrus x bretschneideri]